VSSTDPHPVTGQAFASPVPPGTGWPDDPAAPGTPVARTPAQVPERKKLNSAPLTDTTQ